METHFDKTLSDELLQMAESDKAMRMRLIENESAWDSSVDEANTARLKEIVEHEGWPTIPKVGDEASHAAWLIIQHAPDLEFMKRCLAAMKNAPAGTVSPANIALLEDRVLMMDGKPQIYGTQFQGSGDGMKVYTIQNPAEVDARRASVGLDTFAENKIRLSELYHKSVID